MVELATALALFVVLAVFSGSAFASAPAVWVTVAAMVVSIGLFIVGGV